MVGVKSLVARRGRTFGLGLVGGIWVFGWKMRRLILGRGDIGTRPGRRCDFEAGICNRNGSEVWSLGVRGLVLRCCGVRVGGVGLELPHQYVSENGT